MKKVLIVSYFYPPINSIGTIRISSFVEHLPKLGWQPYIVTSEPSRWVLSDGAAPKGESSEFVCRTPCIDLSRTIPQLFGQTFRAGGVTRGRAQKVKGLHWRKLGMSVYDCLLAFPDSTWPWYFLGCRKAIEFATHVKPDIILSSSPPFTSHVLASEIQGALGIPWVADYRDLWSDDSLVRDAPFQRWTRGKLEARVLRRAHALCTISEPFAEILRKAYSKDAFVVMNGFEPLEEDKGIAPAPGFTIVYTGMIYPGIRDPGLLFDVVHSLKERARLPPGFRISFYGPDHDVTSRMALDAGVADLVECHSSVPRAEALRRQRGAQMLLVLGWSHPKAKGEFPAKFFEYLGAGRPMLVLSPRGGSMDLAMKETGTGRACGTALEIERAILEAVAVHRRGGDPLPERRPREIAKYTRESQARLLASRLDSLSR